MSDSIQQIYQSNPTVLVDGEYEMEDVKKIFIQQKFDLVPVVNNRGELIDIILWDEILNNGKKPQKAKINVPVVIMAGGKGTRMEPFTKILPKPLVPIHEKPIIEHIIERFTDVGCEEFHLTVNYKGRIIKAYFEELQPDYRIKFVEEEEALGTGGSLRLLDGQFSQPFFVTNCDIIIKTDYASLYEFHQKGVYDITLVASAKEYIIPYGTCELNSDGHLSNINEKPHYDFLINTGLYVLNPDVLELIPENKFYHITHLIEDAKNLGKKIGVFPIDEDAWIDVGQWAEYRRAMDQL
jgi:NDP-sugar pyrophosphorylase family protein